MSIIERIKSWEAFSLVQIPISMAPPLKYINSYVLRDEGGVTIVDPGPRTTASELEWQEVWRALRIESKEISQIVITHHHPDHFGMAGYFQEMTGAPVLMSLRAFEEAQRMWGEQGVMDCELVNLFRQHGMPLEWLRQLPDHLSRFYPQVMPFPKVTPISESNIVIMGGRSWEPVMTGGHASGHLSFYSRQDRIMLCGDAVLPQISPNIGLLPGSDLQPLQTFMSSLDKLGAYEVTMAFPGHRNPFSHFSDRLRMLISHHEERLNKIEELLKQKSMTGFEVCSALFGTRLGIHQMRFAMSEAIAHLYELVRQQRASAEMSNGSELIYYGS